MYKVRWAPFMGNEMIVIICSCYYDYFCYQSQCRGQKRSQEQLSKSCCGEERQKAKSRYEKLWGRNVPRIRCPPTFHVGLKNLCIVCLFAYAVLSSSLCPLLYSVHTLNTHTLLRPMRGWVPFLCGSFSCKFIHLAGCHNKYSQKYIWFQRLLSTLRSVCCLCPCPLPANPSSILSPPSPSVLSPCHVSASLPHVPELFIQKIYIVYKASNSSTQKKKW